MRLPLQQQRHIHQPEQPEPAVPGSMGEQVEELRLLRQPENFLPAKDGGLTARLLIGERQFRQSRQPPFHFNPQVAPDVEILKIILQALKLAPLARGQIEVRHGPTVARRTKRGVGGSELFRANKQVQITGMAHFQPTVKRLRQQRPLHAQKSNIGCRQKAAEANEFRRAHEGTPGGLLRRLVQMCLHRGRQPAAFGRRQPMPQEGSDAMPVQQGVEHAGTQRPIARECRQRVSRAQRAPQQPDHGAELGRPGPPATAKPRIIFNRVRHGFTAC